MLLVRMYVTERIDERKRTYRGDMGHERFSDDSWEVLGHNQKNEDEIEALHLHAGFHARAIPRTTRIKGQDCRKG